MRKKLCFRGMIFLILLIAISLRLFLINSGCIWLDEGYKFIQSQNLKAYLNYLIYDTNPPLMPFLLHFWIKFFGKSEFALRLFPLTFSILGLILIGILGLNFFDKRFTLFFLSFLSTSPFFIKYSRDVTPYAVVLFFAILSTYLFLKLLNRQTGYNKKIFFLCYFLVLTGGLYTHYSFIYIYFAQIITIIIHRRNLMYSDFKHIIRVFLWAAIISFPVIYQIVSQYFFIGGYRWIPDFNFHILWDTLLTIASTKLNLLILLCCLCVAIYLRINKKNPHHKILIDYLILAGPLPILLIAILSKVYYSFFVDRYFLLSAFAIWFLICLSTSKMKIYSLLFGIIIIGNISKLPVYYEYFTRDYDKRNLFCLLEEVVKNRKKKRDVVLFKSYRDFVSSIVYNWDKNIPQYVVNGRVSNVVRYYFNGPYFISRGELRSKNGIFYFANISLQQAMKIKEIQGVKVKFQLPIYPCMLYFYQIGHGGRETPVPIPNTEAKPASALGRFLETGWESRTPPGFFIFQRFPKEMGIGNFPILARVLSQTVEFLCLPYCIQIFSLQDLLLGNKIPSLCYFLLL